MKNMHTVSVYLAKAITNIGEAVHEMSLFR